MAQGNQAADQAAKTAALQNYDPIGVATLVSKTNLPETPSYTEGETLKAKSKRRSYGVVLKGGTSFSAWEPPLCLESSVFRKSRTSQPILLFFFQPILKISNKKDNPGDIPGMQGGFTNNSPLHPYCP